MDALRIYVHIPFCKSKCSYCDFTSFEKMEHMSKAYFSALMTEVSLYSEQLRGRKIDSIFFGGGTPSYVNKEYIKDVLACFKFDDSCEVSLEANPGTISYSDFIEYKNMGINRISMGAQSFDNRLLQLMGRKHSRMDTINCVIDCKSAGISNINLDLMFGYPTQKMDVFEESLTMVKSLDIPHVSTYSLSVEEGTLLYDMINKSLLTEPDEQLDRQMYHMACSSLNSHGIKQYEISNFAKEGYESRHNIGYWKREEYIGFGISAHSLYKNVRSGNVEDMFLYIDKLKNFEKPVDTKEELSELEIIKEHIILRLRLEDGLDINEFNNTFNTDFNKHYETQINSLQDKKLLAVSDTHIYLTKQGKDIANQVFVEFM